MQHSTDTSDIKPEIEKFGHTVVNIFNIKQNRIHISLPLYFVDLKPSENNKDICQIETLNYTKVKLEPPRPKRNIRQCSKCQRYGHTQAYCYHSPRCVKCAGSHLTKQCPRKKNQKMSNAFSAMVIIQPTTKDTPSTKTYKREPSRPYETNRTEEIRKAYRAHKSHQTASMLLLLNLNNINMRLLLDKPTSKQYISSNRNCRQVTYKN